MSSSSEQPTSEPCNKPGTDSYRRNDTPDRLRCSARSRRFEILEAKRPDIALRAGLIGPSGAGKTYSALRLATGIAEVVGGDIIMLDTENNRGQHYADAFRFRHVDMGAPFGSADYRSALSAIAATKPAVIIVDSLSHEHEGEGGLLDAHDRELERLAGDNATLALRLQSMAWRRPKAERRALLSQLMRLDCHMIFCIRAAERTRPARDESQLRQEMGLTPITGPEFLYEMTFSALLYPGSGGRPTWSSPLPGEAGAIKRPEQLNGVLSDDGSFSEQTGKALALWARSKSHGRTRTQEVGANRSKVSAKRSSGARRKPARARNTGRAGARAAPGASADQDQARKPATGADRGKPSREEAIGR